MNKTNLIFCLGFSHFLGVGPFKFKKLMQHFQSVQKAYKSNKDELMEILGPKTAGDFIEFRMGFDPEKKLTELKKKSIAVIPISSPAYPVSLKNIPDPPICLYVIGNNNLINQNDDRIFLSIVGTRMPSSYGQQVAYKMAKNLVQSGFVVVSGLAYGIDALAHKGALDGGGMTVAVLGQGVDIVYPAAHYNLYRRITENNGAIISEFPPGQPVVKGLFVARNRIISGLSQGVIVVEGSKHSGTLITARYAAEQGKDLFAVPGRITDPMAQAPNILIKNGAKLTTGPDDILEEYGITFKTKKEAEPDNLNEDENMIFKLLKKEEQTADELSLVFKKPVREILNIITILEIKGLVEKNGKSKYQVKLS